MTTKELLPEMAGYQEALNSQRELEAIGQNFTDVKGNVAAIVGQLHPKRLSLVVAEIIDETASAKTLRMKSENGPLPPFQAGQYVNLFVTIDGVNTARPFSISSGPSQGTHYDLTIRRAPDGFVSSYLLDEVKVGMRFESTGPMGAFFHNPLFHTSDRVFLAGGSGIAPAMSMALDIIAHNLPDRLHIIYGSRRLDDIIFREQLETLEQAHDFLTVTQVISEPPPSFTGRTGFLNAALISEAVGELETKTFYVCGPAVMNEFCEAELARLGISPTRIRVDTSGAPSKPSEFEHWPNEVSEEAEVTVTVHGRGSFQARTGEPLLNALERNGFFVENACRSGECSLCRVKVLAGEVVDAPQSRLRQSDRQFQWHHACVTYPVGNIEILF